VVFFSILTRAGLFYEGLVVASRQGAPLTEPPQYGEASPALEHLVLYDDGSSEWLTLKNEKVRYVQATRAAQLVGQVTASLSADDDMDWFAAPVEAEALGLVDYHNVVSEPMDLGTVDDRVRSPRFEVLRCLHAIDATRVHLTMKWVVSFWILRPFGPRRETAMLRAGTKGLLRPDADG